MSFELFALNPLLHKALQKTGYQTAHPAQAALLPHYAQGHDLFITAAPGSGKTTACLIAALHQLLETPAPDNAGPLLIVMTPGREQAHHVIRTFKEITRHLADAPRIALCPNPYRVEDEEDNVPTPSALSAPVLVATPENLIDCIKEELINLTPTQTVIYKNADQLLDAGYWHELERIHRTLPAQHQSIFLTTHSYEGDLAEVSRIFQKSPFTYSDDQQSPKPEHSERVHIADNLAHKMALLDFIVRDGEVSAALVLTNTTACANKLAHRLQELGLPNTLLAPAGQQVFDVTLSAQQKKYLPDIFIGTHASARLFKPRASHVINFNFPSCADDYFARFAYLDLEKGYPALISLVDKVDQKKLLLLENYRDKPLLRGLIPGLEPRAGHKPRRGRFSHAHKEPAGGDRGNEYSGFMRSNTRRGHNNPAGKSNDFAVPNKTDSKHKPQFKTPTQDHGSHIKKGATRPAARTESQQRVKDPGFSHRPSYRAQQTRYDEQWDNNQKHKNEPLIKVQKKPTLGAEQSPQIVEKIKSSRILGRLGLTKK